MIKHFNKISSTEHNYNYKSIKNSGDVIYRGDRLRHGCLKHPEIRPLPRRDEQSENKYNVYVNYKN